jgi:hypothetical protein
LLTLLLSTLITGAAVAGSQSSVDAVSELQLRDQYGHEDSLAEHRGEVVVVMVVTVKRLRNIRPCERQLREQFEEIHVLRIADVPEDSPATHESVTAKLGEHVPEGVSVLIDLDRIWATELGLDTGRPNLLVIDRDGRLITTFRGLCKPELFAPVVEQLEKLLEGS